MLYAMLNEVDKEHMNVLSLEDPVEYSMDGVSQSQIHPEIDYTFATGLRTTLRQDPDVIMVGEIRIRKQPNCHSSGSNWAPCFLHSTH